MDRPGSPVHTAQMAGHDGWAGDVAKSGVNSLWHCLRAAVFCIVLSPAAPASAQHPGAEAFEVLASSPYVHCAFYRDYDIDPETGARLLVEGRSLSLTHFQRPRNGRVRAIDTRQAGATEARIVRGGKYLHYIQRSGPMYVVTTVYACLARDPQTDHCINYGAVNARHFDVRVLRDPDAVFEELQELAEPGFCDHSFIHVQEAAGPLPQRQQQ